MRPLLIAQILVLATAGFAVAWDANPHDGATMVQPIDLPPERRAEEPAPAQPPAARPPRPRATPSPRPAEPVPVLPSAPARPVIPRGDDDDDDDDEGDGEGDDDD